MKQRLLVMLILMGIVAGCRATTPSVDRRVRNHFQMTEVKELTPESVRQALLAKLPPGTSEPQIYEFLKRSGVGQDKFSAFYPVDDDHRIFCHIDADPGTYSLFGSKHKGYAIYFVLDYRNQLHDIRVQSWSPEDVTNVPPGTATAGRDSTRAQAPGMQR
jgi:hypothetical protein